MSNSEAIITSSSLSQLLFELKHIELKISDLRRGKNRWHLLLKKFGTRERENQPALIIMLVIARDKKRVGGRVVVLERGVF